MGRLVQIEITNFKSYRGRHVVGPFKDFTAVVGPNGAGKSNLMDAISFVLGVQSAHLRSTNMRELIYRGRAVVDEEGREIAASTESATSANITAIYADADGVEYTLSRTIANDGTSDYVLNGTAVRQKEYVAFLETQNILVKARNFLVFQGDVETVAQQNPRDLTKLIEQVAGSIELKPQHDALKDAMDKAIDASSTVFQRRKVVQQEVKQFHAQKEDAARFAALERDHADLVLTQALWRLYHLERDLAAIADAHAAAEAAREECAAIVQEVEVAVNGARQQLANATRDLVRAERALSAKQKAADDLAPTAAQRQQRHKHAADKLARLTKQRAAVTRDLARHEDAIADLDRQLADVARALRALDATAAAASGERARLAEFQQEYERVHAEYLMQSAAVQSRLDSLLMDLSARKEAHAAAEARRAAAARKLEAIETDARPAREKHQRVTVGLADSRAELAELDAAIAQDAAKDAKLHADELQLQEKYDSLCARLSDYRQDQRATQREKQLAQLVAELKAEFPGVHGRLADLCSPANDKHGVAVAAALGRHLDAIVADKRETVAKCFAYMKEQRKGYADFIPMADVVVKEVTASLRSFQGARPALDVVVYDKEVEQAIKYACGTTLVAESLEVARHICFEKDIRVKCVTHGGQVIHKGGMMSGQSGGQGGPGSQQRTTWQARDVEKMTQAVEQIKLELQEIAKEKRRDRESPLTRRAMLAEQVAYTAKMESDLSAKLAALETEAAAHTQQLRGAERKLQEMDVEMVDAEVEELQASLDAMRDSAFASFCERAGVASAAEFERVVLESAVQEAKERQALAAQLSALENTRAYEHEQHEALQARVAKLDASVREATAAVATAAADVTQQEEALQAMLEEVAVAQEAVDAARTERDARTAAQTKARRQLADARKSMSDAEQAKADHETTLSNIHQHRFMLLRRTRVEGIDVKLRSGTWDGIQSDAATAATRDDGSSTQQSQQISESIEIDFGPLKRPYREDGSPEKEKEIADRLQEISDELERLAPHQPALDKMRGVESAFNRADREFNAARRTAKEAKDAFEAVRDERLTRFMEAYVYIHGCIDRVYKDLTRSRNFPTGGTAYLSLESEDDPFSSGIKYHAMPPGKRFRDMEQLSGGEKTMAALALLFAINSYKPSPFFVLDEVDAALDNANVAKIARYVALARIGGHGKPAATAPPPRPLDHGTQMVTGPEPSLQQRAPVQFVVISLKHTLYERAQALVGVHRDNDVNTSAIMTLDLEQFEE
ncbi:RecF/RecN/SMC [Blastocladiella britannica]|nr:RecF/RecN/SMC [Blastocladiella britannica]